MKRVMMTALVMLGICGLLLGSASGGDKKEEKKNGKVHTVGKDGLKVDGKITDDDKQYDYKVTLEGNDLELKLRAKVYMVKLDGDTKYTITINTDDDEFDPFLVVHDEKGAILAYDDDSGGKLNSKLDYTPKKGGIFAIHAAGLRDTSGPYTLKIVAGKGKDDAKPKDDAVNAIDAQERETQREQREPATGGGEKKGGKVLTVGKDGLKIDAKITGDDKVYPFKLEFDGKEFDLKMAAKVYSVKLDGGASYTITMDTDDDDFDPFVVIHDEGGKTVAFDDDSGGKLNSKLTYAPKKDGTYKIHAAALKGTGPYTLKIVGGKGADPKKVLSVGKEGLRITGSLSEDVRKIDYQVQLKGGKSYRIDMRSKVFDTYLYFYGPDGKKLDEDDDGGGKLDSRITHKAAADGTYRITASSFEMAGSGEFVLEVREVDD